MGLITRILYAVLVPESVKQAAILEELKKKNKKIKNETPKTKIKFKQEKSK